MTQPAKLLIAERLAALAADMRGIAELMTHYEHPPAFRQHASEMRGAADMAQAWAEEIGAPVSGFIKVHSSTRWG